MTPSRVDHYCTTADGTLCRVTYINPAGTEAELSTIEHGGSLSLPVAELRRVPDPRNQRPPIAGMPTERPRCAWCDRGLKPLVDDTWNGDRGLGRRMIARVFLRWRAYESVFCTTRCAIRFAGASYRGGFRRKTKAA